MSDTKSLVSETAQKLREAERDLCWSIEHLAANCVQYNDTASERNRLRMAIAAHGDALIAHHNAVEAAKREK